MPLGSSLAYRAHPVPKSPMTFSASNFDELKAGPSEKVPSKAKLPTNPVTDKSDELDSAQHHHVAIAKLHEAHMRQQISIVPAPKAAAAAA